MSEVAVSFRTKVDLWLLGVLAVALGVALLSMISTFDSVGAFPLVVLIGTIVFVLAVSVPTEYTMTNDELIIRSGIVRTRISLESIQEAFPSGNALSAPAWSLDRLEIKYHVGDRRRSALISPKRKTEFLALLEQRAGLSRIRNGLVRRS